MVRALVQWHVQPEKELQDLGRKANFSSKSRSTEGNCALKMYAKAFTAITKVLPNFLQVSFSAINENGPEPK